jgi:hypothetical protein
LTPFKCDRRVASSLERLFDRFEFSPAGREKCVFLSTDVDLKHNKNIGEERGVANGKDLNLIGWILVFFITFTKN